MSRARLVAAVLALAAFARLADCAAAPTQGTTRGHAATPTGPGSDRHIAILCYHDLSDSALTPLQTTSAGFLRQQIRACRAAGWTFVPLSELLAHRDHPELLPARTLVLTFDDGYRSFRDRALPVLRAERVPATLAVISSFVDQPPTGLPPLLSWDELREVARDTLVDIASHSHALHRYDTMNPYRDSAPSIATRRYLLAEMRYENREEYRGRIRDDLDSARRVLRERLDVDAAVLVWPYGVHNEMARAQARLAGFRATLSLGDREVTRDDLRSGCLPRIMVTRRLRFDGDEAAWLAPSRPAIRAADIDLDDVYSPDPAVFRERVEQLVRRVRAIGATHAFLRVCSEPAGDGLLSAAWCMNHQVFVRADVWSMVAAQLSRARISVWARVPTLNLTWAWQQHPEWRIGADVRTERVGTRIGPSVAGSAWPTRVSPNLPEVQRAAIDFLTDLAVYAPIDGMVFDGDASMAAGEHLALTRTGQASDNAEAIDELIGRCRDAVLAWRPDCRFARVVDAAAVEAPGAAHASAQDFAHIVRDNDLTILVARTEWCEQAGAARRVERLARRAVDRWRAARALPTAAGSLRSPAPGRRGRRATAASRPREIPPVSIELHTLDRASGRWVPSRSIAELLAATRRAGVSSASISPVTPSAGDLPEALFDAGAPAPPLTGDPSYR